MKIVDRTTFLALPANTVFCKYEPCTFGTLSIKGDTIMESGDFYYQSVTDCIELGPNEFSDALFWCECEGASVKMAFNEVTRDGLFDGTQLFAVWEHGDIVGLIERLKQCIDTLQ